MSCLKATVPPMKSGDPIKVARRNKTDKGLIASSELHSHCPDMDTCSWVPPLSLVALWMIWNRSMAVVVAMNSQVVSDTANPEMEKRSSGKEVPAIANSYCR